MKHGTGTQTANHKPPRCRRAPGDPKPRGSREHVARTMANIPHATFQTCRTYRSSWYATHSHSPTHCKLSMMDARDLSPPPFFPSLLLLFVWEWQKSGASCGGLNHPKTATEGGPDTRRLLEGETRNKKGTQT